MSTKRKYRKKQLIKKRGNFCEMCGYVGLLVVHHVLPVRLGGNNRCDNLRLLCEQCHADEHGYIKKKWLDPNREHWIEDLIVLCVKKCYAKFHDKDVKQ